MCLPPKPLPKSGTIDPHLFVGQAERAGEFAVIAKRILRPGPDGQLAVLPLCHGHAGFQRRVLDVGHLVRLAEHLLGPGQFFREGIRGHAALDVLPQVVEQSRARRVWDGFPLGGHGDGRQRLPSAARWSARPRPRTGHPGPPRLRHRFGRRQSIDTSVAPYAGGRRTLPYSMPGRAMSDGKLMRAGHQVANVRTRHRGPEDFPLLDGRHSDVGRHRLLEQFGDVVARGQFGVAERALRGVVSHPALAHEDGIRFDAPALGGVVELAVAARRPRPVAPREQWTASSDCRRWCRRRAPAPCRP